MVNQNTVTNKIKVNLNKLAKEKNAYLSIY